MSLSSLPLTLFVALAASALAVLRTCKNPEASQAYLQKVLVNNHGQNLLYIASGMIGFVNYLYYAPMVVFFLYGIAEFVKIKYPQSGMAAYADLARNNKGAVLECKGYLELIFVGYLLLTLPLDFMGRAVKAFITAQVLVIKYSLNPEFRQNCASFYGLVDQKLTSFPILQGPFRRAACWIYSYASQRVQA